METDNIRSFVDGLKTEAGLYAAMVEITERHTEALAADSDSTAMLELLARKQRVLRDIEQIETKIHPIKEAWATVRQQAPADLRDQAEDLMRNLKETIAGLIEMETRWHTRVYGQKQKTAAELKKLEQVRKTSAAYRTSGPHASARYMDRIQ